uniref:Uncharacterized protein n=1 Tax=Leersia perrieri TaxID=77586 RepID=A0A0D9XXR1_9ORYZ
MDLSHHQHKNKKVEEQCSGKEHGKAEAAKQQHGRSRVNPELVEYVDISAVHPLTAFHQRKYEAATGEKAVNKVVTLFNKEETYKDQKEEDQEVPTNEHKNKGVVYQF